MCRYFWRDKAKPLVALHSHHSPSLPKLLKLRSPPPADRKQLHRFIFPELLHRKHIPRIRRDDIRHQQIDLARFIGARRVPVRMKRISAILTRHWSYRFPALLSRSVRNRVGTLIFATPTKKPREDIRRCKRRAIVTDPSRNDSRVPLVHRFRRNH